MKKMTPSKAKFYANQILSYENELSKTQDKQKTFEIQDKITEIVDTIVEQYEPTAMYKVDEAVYSIIKKQ